MLKGIPAPLIAVLQKNMQIRGAKLLSYNGGVTSAAHTEADIDQTLDIFEDTIHTLVREQVLGRVG